MEKDFSNGEFDNHEIYKQMKNHYLCNYLKNAMKTKPNDSKDTEIIADIISSINDSLKKDVDPWLILDWIGCFLQREH